MLFFYQVISFRVLLQFQMRHSTFSKPLCVSYSALWNFIFEVCTYSILDMKCTKAILLWSIFLYNLFYSYGYLLYEHYKFSGNDIYYFSCSKKSEYFCDDFPKKKKRRDTFICNSNIYITYITTIKLV